MDLSGQSWGKRMDNALPMLGRALVLRLSFGTEALEISPNDLRDFPVVCLSNQVENDIADLAERASALRMTADQKENETVDPMERAVDAMLSNVPVNTIPNQQSLPTQPSLPFPQQA
jgi:hypothetical protein